MADVTDQITCLRDVIAAYALIEAMLEPGDERPASGALGSTLRILNGELARRVAEVEMLVTER